MNARPYVFVLALAACGDAAPNADDPPATGASSTTAAPSSTDGSSDTTAATTTESSSGASSDGPSLKLDVGSADDSAGMSSMPCQGIDFLFVVDNSNSMAFYQGQLAQAVPGFVAALADVAPTDDYRAMVVDTDAERLMGYACPDEACCDYVCEHGNPAGPCDGNACSGTPPAFGCDDTMGAGIVAAANGTACNVVPGTRWFASSQPDFAEAFECAALIGANSYWQWPAAAMTQAIAPELIGAGGCNEGFLRDDALLVVVWLGDEDEPAPGEHPWPSAGDPKAWYEALVAAKGGNPNGVAFIAIAYDPSPMLGQVVDMLGDNGYFMSIHSDIVAGFTDAVATVDLACETFVPVG